MIMLNRRTFLTLPIIGAIAAKLGLKARGEIILPAFANSASSLFQDFKFGNASVTIHPRSYFSDCRFEDCTLVLPPEGEWHLCRCVLTDCRYRFGDGPERPMCILCWPNCSMIQTAVYGKGANVFEIV